MRQQPLLLLLVVVVALCFPHLLPWDSRRAPHPQHQHSQRQQAHQRRSQQQAVRGQSWCSPWQQPWQQQASSVQCLTVLQQQPAARSCALSCPQLRSHLRCQSHQQQQVGQRQQPQGVPLAWRQQAT